MDILQEWFESGEELQSTGLFCHDVPEHLPALDHSDESSTTVDRTLLLLSHATTPTAPPTEGTVASSLLRSHSVDEIHQLSVNQSSLPGTSRELPSIPRCESYRCQSVFPALSCSNADTSNVEIALEMPRYLLQEDEAALVDESGACEDFIPASNKTPTTPHKLPSLGSQTPFKPHRSDRTTSSPTSFKTTLPHKTTGSTLLHKTSPNPAVLSKVLTPHPPTTSVATEEPLQTIKSHHLHANQLYHGQNFDPQSAKKSVSLSETSRKEKDTLRVSHSWSHDSQSQLPSAGPLTVCFSQLSRSSNVNQLTEGARLVNLHATPISIAPRPRSLMNNSSERKKRRHGGGWPKGKSRKLDSHNISLPKPPATGYNIFLSEKQECVREEHGASSMSAVSKVMGQMWSQLSGEEKASYYDQAEQDRQRYIREMKNYFSQLYKGISDVDLEEVENILTANTILENDDQALHCQICHISFMSPNNKRSHFSGRLHRQSVIEHLHRKLASSTNTHALTLAQPWNRDMTRIDDNIGDKDCQEEKREDHSKCSHLVEQLTHVAVQHKATSDQLTEVKQHHSHLIQANAHLQQQINELEYMESNEEAVLLSITREGHSTLTAIQTLSDILVRLGVEHRADGETSTADSFHWLPGQVVGEGRDHASLP